MKRFFPNEPRPEPGGDGEPQPPANPDDTRPASPDPTVPAAGVTAAGATMAHGPAHATSADALLRGASQYQVGGVVARGGMGSILEARELNLDRLVAVKVILTEKIGSEPHRQRFLQEARLTGQLQHPNIVPVYELGNTAEGQPFYTMKFVKGTTLQEALERIVAGDAETITRYSLAHLLTIYQKVCDAVAFSHSRGVVHRDLKPANIMLGEFGEVLVMDWGLAKVGVGDSGLGAGDPNLSNPQPLIPNPGLTLSGQIMGTPNFMAPEQADGRVDQIDARTDIFSLGGVLYNILTLHLPVTGDSVQEVLDRIRSGAILHPSAFNPKSKRQKTTVKVGTAVIPHPPVYPLRHCPGGRIPESLAAVCMKALAVRREDRYQTVPELQRDLEAYQGGFATGAEAAGALKVLWLLVKRHQIEFGLSAAALAVIAVLATGFVVKITASERRATTALGNLQKTAPTSYADAQFLIGEGKLEAALLNIRQAIALAPGEAEYYCLQGNILESLLRIREARDAYAEAVRLDPQHAVAAENLKLCDTILRQNEGRTALLPSCLLDLQQTMRRQGRLPEAIAMLREFSADRQLVYDTWKDVLVKAGWWAGAEKMGMLMAVFLQQDEGGLLSLQMPPLIDDLSPIKGMPLKFINMPGSSVSDLSPLRGMPLTFLSAPGSLLTDLTPLRGLPLRFLSINFTRVKDITPLQGMPLESLELGGTLVTDIQALQGMRLKFLGLSGLPIRDLSVLRGVPLETLGLGSTPVTDLEPLRGMPIRSLQLNDTPITDLSPLRGMPLHDLDLGNCTKLTDLTPLTDCPQLEGLSIPEQCRNIEFLRKLPHLKTLSYGRVQAQPAAEFWKAYDAKKAKEARP